MKFTGQIIFSVLLVALAGCSSSGSGTRDESGAGSVPIGGSAQSSGQSDDAFRQGDAFGEDAALIDRRVIFFGFDRSDINAESMELLAAHARHLASNPGIDVRLEGHTDERGSREYNIGLGERRAQAVREVLLLRGVSSGKLNAVSYGEERPTAMGSNESAWAKNRRVELIYSD